jgi:MFS family permease
MPEETKTRSLRDLYLGKQLPTSVKALGATSFFQDVASEMVYPLLPAFLAALGGGPLVLGAMESISEGVLAILKGAAGRWSDRLGRRKPFVSAGYGLSALTRPFLALAAAAWQVVALRAVDRVAKGLRTAPRDALIAGAVEPGQRAYAFSFHQGLDHLGAAVGPLAAAVVLYFAPGRVRLVFALATIPAVIGWLTVQIFTREPGTAEDAKTPPTGASPSDSPALIKAKAPLPRALWMPLLAFLLFSLGNASDAFLLLRAANAGLGATGLALLWSGFHVVKWLASAPAGRLADRLGPKPQILAGWAVYATVYAGFAFVTGVPALLGWFALYAVYYGLTEGAQRALVVRLAGKDVGLGSSLGAFHLATGLGTFAASLLFGVLWQEISPAAAFLTGAGLAAAGATLLLLARDSSTAPATA